MAAVVKTPEAQYDLQEIIAWLDEHSPAAADRFVEAFEADTQLLGNHPRMGRARDDLLPGLRSIVVGNYIVFFRTKNSQVEILHVIHGSRDITPDMFSP